ncbi:MAG: hypothetical protein ACRDZN_14540 [Acidimicrobiales bacterium]
MTLAATVREGGPGGSATLSPSSIPTARRLAADKLPEAVRIVPELRLTSTEKVDRRALARREREAAAGL